MHDLSVDKTQYTNTDFLQNSSDRTFLNMNVRVGASQQKRSAYKTINRKDTLNFFHLVHQRAQLV